MAILERVYSGVNWCQESTETCREKLHIRDWSEVFVVMAAIYSLRKAFQSSPRDINALIKNPHFALFLVLGGVEVRIRQLWVNYTLDKEVEEFQRNNHNLRGEIRDLTEENTRLQQELQPLKEAEQHLSDHVGRLGTENTHLKREVDRLQREEERFQALEKQLRGELETGQVGLKQWEARLQLKEQQLNDFGQQLVKQSQDLNARIRAFDAREEKAR